MYEVRINKFKTRYRLPQSALAERRRLDHACQNVLDEALELALERAGAPEDGELCIRRIYAPIRLRLVNTDAEMAVQWSLALAEEISRAVRGARVANAVFYRSRREALLDLALGAMRGDLSRAWAWRQLGLWNAAEPTGEDETIFELVRALVAEPLMICPALRALLEAGLIERLTGRMTTGQWESLARSALFAAGVAHLSDEADQAPSPRAVRDAMRVLKSSRLLHALIGAPLLPFLPLLNDAPRESYRAIAALTVLEMEPGLLRTHSAPALIGLVAEALQSARAESINALSEPPAGQSSAESVQDAGPFGSPDAASEPAEQTPLPDPRRRAPTRFGGLLFLLGVIEDLGLPDEMLSQAMLGPRSLCWTLHQLALALAPIEADDPAALAFAGLLPDAKPPDAEQSAPGEIEAGAVQNFAGRIIGRLRALLDWDADDAALIAFVCRRHAEIVADPGWIEVRFPLDDVTTELRRAGLDLDPGYLPWLGAVVRFVYE